MRYFLVCLLLFSFLAAPAQILIGYEKSDIVKYIAEQAPDFELAKSDKAFLLYYSRLNGDSICYNFDFDNLCAGQWRQFPEAHAIEVINTLNRLFGYPTKGKWIDIRGGLIYLLNPEKRYPGRYCLLILKMP